MKIDIATETTSLFGEGQGYIGGVIGEDCDVYAIPAYAINVIKFNTTTQEMLEVGNRCDDDYDEDEGDKWSGGVLHSNGYIYCAPYCNNKVLKVKTNHIRDEGKNLLESKASLTEFNKYVNTYQFEYIYISHKDLYDRLVSYRNSLIVNIEYEISTYVNIFRTVRFKIKRYKWKDRIIVLYGNEFSTYEREESENRSIHFFHFFQKQIEGYLFSLSL